jgi:hypothetical protein
MGACRHCREDRAAVGGSNFMEPIERVSRWLTGEGRFVSGNYELLQQFCGIVVEAGIPLARSWLHIRALRPEFAGVSRIWRRGAQIEERFLDHGFEKTAVYLNSPVRFVVERRELQNWRLDSGKVLPFPVLEELRAAGYVHYAIAPIIFSDETANAISWATDQPGGFSSADLQFFAEILPSFSLVVELKSLRRFVTNVLSTYVGREPGELILKGQVRRGDVRTITAALMLVDLRDFTAISDAQAGFALHHGQVSYGNIGAGDRLDFTVIGPDVNLTSRIERLCRELDRQLIMSKDFVTCLDRPMFEIGHFQLRGFSQMQLLFGPPAA